MAGLRSCGVAHGVNLGGSARPDCENTSATHGRVLAPTPRPPPDPAELPGGSKHVWRAHISLVDRSRVPEDDVVSQGVQTEMVTMCHHRDTGRRQGLGPSLIGGLTLAVRHIHTDNPGQLEVQFANGVDEFGTPPTCVRCTELGRWECKRR